MEKWREDVEHEIALDFIKWLNNSTLAPEFAQGEEGQKAMRNWLNGKNRQVEPRCENCKHWQRISGWEGGKCSMMSETGDSLSPNACIIFQVGCSRRSVLHNREPWVHTMPDFGCTLFERKGGE